MTAPEFKAWMTARGLRHADIVTRLQVARATVDLWRQSGTRYITDVAAVLKSDDMRLELADDLSPGVLRGAGPEDAGYTAVVMPMRI